MSLSSPNGVTAQIEVVHPTNPSRIRFKMNILELLGQEASITSSEIKETKPFFCLRQVERFPCNQSRATSPDISCP